MDEEFDVSLGPPAKKLCEDMIYLSSDSSSESSEDFLFPSDTENENAVFGLQDEMVSSQHISVPVPENKWDLHSLISTAITSGATIIDISPLSEDLANILRKKNAISSKVIHLNPSNRVFNFFFFFFTK